MSKLAINREATPEDTFYRVRVSRGLRATLSPEQKKRLRQFNRATAAIAGKPLSRLPVMPVRNMIGKKLGPMNVGFKYGIAAKNRGFTMATNYFDVLLNGVRRIPPLFVLSTGSAVQRSLEKEGMGIIRQFNTYMHILARGDIHGIRGSVEITREPETGYLKVEPAGKPALKVDDPVVLVKTLVRPYEERSGVPFNLKAGS